MEMIATKMPKEPMAVRKILKSYPVLD